MSNTPSVRKFRRRPASRRSAPSRKRKSRSTPWVAIRPGRRAFLKKSGGAEANRVRSGGRMSTSDALTAPQARALRLDGVALPAALATLLGGAPVRVVLVLAVFGAGETVTFGANLTRDGAIGTLTLMLAGGGGAIILGAGAAWLVSLCRFPGRGVFEWLLVIPLAAPSYVLAYSYTSL